MFNSEYGKYFVCCKGCVDRTMLCHSTCEKYLGAKKMVEELKKKKNLEKTIYTKRQFNRVAKYDKSK